MKHQTCIIVDIDGTLADNSRRSPYDLTQIQKDPVNYAVANIANRAYENVEVILMSGRDESAREDTEAWLDKYLISYSALYMRPAGDTRPDTEIKKELYEKHIKNTYEVLFAIDDRNRIVDQRRAMGIYTLDCNQTRKEF